MKNINKHLNIKYLVLAFLAVMFTACETTDLDINENPNALSPDSADPSLVLNGIQFGLTNQTLGLHNATRGVMRHTNMFGTYAANTGAGALNGVWSNTYSIANNTRLLATLNESQALANHLGMAQVIEVMAFAGIVDYIGQAPFSEAIDASISAPNFDAGQDIYNALYAQLDTAIANLNMTDQIAPEDLYYNGDMSKWVKLANSVKIQMYVNSKLVNNPNATTDINAIIASGNYISSPADDLVAQFNTQNDNPDARHPDYVLAYNTGAGNIYMSNEFMNILLNDKTVEDPRTNFYIYRQTLTDPTGDLLPCAGLGGFNFCYLGNGYWGRDHADDEGIPNDGSLRATFGVYPAGGAFDDGTTNTNTLAASDLGGAGIFPIMLSSTVNFWLAEAALPAPAGLGVTGNSRDYLAAGMADSFAKVAAFAGQTMTNVATYEAEVLANYDAAGTDNDRLGVIIKEVYISSWGNSTPAYNNYRRTGFPALGGSVIANTDFPRNFLIPDSELNSNDNPNLVQITRTDQVFWDTNPAGFIE